MMRTDRRRPFALAACLAAPLALAALAAPVAAQTEESGGRLDPRQACFDVRSYHLNLAVVPERKAIAGRLTMTAELVAESESVVLDLDSRLRVARVLVGDVEVEAVHADGRIAIPLPEAARTVGGTLTVAVDYAGTPRVAPNPPWVGGFTWSETPSGAPWIATSCQMEGADLWWPCKDHPSDKAESFTLTCTVPDDLVVASNGRLESVTEGPGGRTFRWHTSTPIPNYSVALNIAPYETISEEYTSTCGDVFDVTFWVLPEHLDQGRELFPELVAHLRDLEELCGPYPFRADKYGVVETPHLGMEHQTIIAYGNGFRGDPVFDYDWLHHHELSHEWWANLVTAADWSDFWIHEGIGTYMQALYLERKFGPEAYRQKMQLDLERVLNRAPVAPAGPRGTQTMYFASDEAPGIDVYMKGSWICHTLRWVLGDEAFFRVLRRWAYPEPELEATTDGSAVRTTDTAELLAIAERVSGEELGWFFDLYLRQPTLPRLEAREEGGELVLTWHTPEDRPFPMPVEVRVGTERVRVECPGGVGRTPLGGQDWAVDPDHRILMQRP